jgi:hypothetical protein
MNVTANSIEAPWLLLLFSLPATRASQRVEVWRKLKRYGALPLRGSGYVLPNTPSNQERLTWLAVAIRKYQGQASVAQVHAIDDLPADELAQRFLEARARDYRALLRELKRMNSRRRARGAAARMTRLRQRFQEVAAIDFFHSPLRSRVEGLLEQADATSTSHARTPSEGQRTRKEYLSRTWMTRLRPGIDRVASAWLIRRFIDPQAQFRFGSEPSQVPGAVPFDMFAAEGFGHRGENCTFETLEKEFGIHDPKVRALGQIVHDADLNDEKFGRWEGIGLDRTLIGWAHQGIADEELLRRGMELIDGLYHSLP